MTPIARLADITAAGCPLLMAQLPAVSPGELGSWVITAAAVLVIANQGLAMTERFRASVKERPDPQSTYISKPLCEAMHSGHEARVRKVETDQADLSRMIREEIRGLHGRIDELMQALSAGRIKV